VSRHKESATDRDKKIPYFFLGSYHYEDVNISAGTFKVTKSNLSWTPYEFAIQRISPTSWDNSKNPETAN
jgi:hypothetical protein